VAEALRRLGLIPAGGNYATFAREVDKFGIDISHFTGQAHLRDKTCLWVRKKPLSDILIQDSDYTTTSYLRKRLLSEGYFKHKCYSCNRTKWIDQPIPLELEHKNGVKGTIGLRI